MQSIWIRSCSRAGASTVRWSWDRLDSIPARATSEKMRSLDISVISSAAAALRISSSSSRARSTQRRVFFLSCPTADSRSTSRADDLSKRRLLVMPTRLLPGRLA